LYDAPLKELWIKDILKLSLLQPPFNKGIFKSLRCYSIL